MLRGRQGKAKGEERKERIERHKEKNMVGNRRYYLMTGACCRVSQGWYMQKRSKYAMKTA